MTLLVHIDGIENRLELLREGETCRFCYASQPEKVALVQQPEPGVYSVLIDGRSYEARVEPSEGRVFVWINGRRFDVEVRDPRRWSAGKRGLRAEGRENLTAPMPGKVVRVLVALGDVVEPGQGVVVVEAMKMQNEMKASRAGRVFAIPVREGATVSAGEILATIE
jgi:biotin carboxyl carrier protein